MILKQIDFLSPEITLFYKGSLSHPSIISGILTIFTCISIILCSICYVKCILDRKTETPEISTYNRFTEDAGEFPINSSSFFHFISILKDYHFPNCEGFDFTYFNLIGLETFVKDYENDNDLTKYNHWLYGLCNNESDTQGINHLINQNFFNKSACIKKYYSSSENQYYDIGHPNFKWPKMAHGTFNPNKEFYSLIMIKCDQNILNTVFGDKYQCIDDGVFEKIVKNGGAIHFNFIDQYVDILEYEEPIKKYFYNIENSLDLENYSVNHLNFNPAKIRTHNGFFFDKIQENLTYVYERNDVYIKSRNNKNILMAYSLWMNNRMNYYERVYKRIQDVLSDVGGVAQAITTIIIFINNFINKYIIILDTEALLTKAKISVQEICAKKNKIIIKNATKPLKKDHENLNSVKQDSNIDRNISLETKDNMLENNNKNVSKKQTIENSIYNNEKNYKFEDTNIVTNKGNEKSDNNNKENKKEKITFWYFLLYKFTCGKKHHSMILFEKFREKVISVENLIINHLNIHNLLKANDTNLYCE